MKFSELIKEDRAFQLYELLKAFFAVKKLFPFCAVRIDKGKITYFVIMSEIKGKKGIYKSHFKMPKVDAVFFGAWLAGDFPWLEFAFTDLSKKDKIVEKSVVFSRNRTVSRQKG